VLAKSKAEIMLLLKEENNTIAAQLSLLRVAPVAYN
jgi:hypothetical protein